MSVHDIEVEDDVTAYCEFANGATGVFITSTGEAPGTNRLEIAAERGRLVYENDTLSFTRNEVPMSECSKSSTQAFARPDSDLFGLGLDSLRAFDLLDQLADEGVQVDFAAFTVEPTVAFLSRQLPVPVP